MMKDRTKALLIGITVLILNAIAMGVLSPPIWINLLWSVFLGATLGVYLETKYKIISGFFGGGA